MGERKECWVTTALDTIQCVKALVLAKSLRRVMTSRSLVVIVSHLLPDELLETLQDEFDVCIQLDRKWLSIQGMSVDEYAKMYIWGWSMLKWSKIVFLDPNTLVVKNCDEIFQLKPFTVLKNYDFAVFVAKPSPGIWKQILATIQEGSIATENKILEKIFNEKGSKFLDVKYNMEVNLSQASVAKNLNDILIVKFNGVHPMDIFHSSGKDTIPGILEKALMELWKNHFDNGVAQRIANFEVLNQNGLKSYLEKYRNSSPDFFLPPEMPENYNNAIAIIGISCRFPGANNLDEFWKLLIEGRDAIRHCPEGRWTLEKCPVLSEDSKDSQAGFLNCSIEDFDGKFFGVSPMELSFMDPQQRLTLQVAWEALEDAAIDPLSLKDTYTGVFGGAWRTDYREALQNTGVSELEFFRSYLGNSLGVITARISHCLGLTGPSIGTESGCSSSIVAVDLACKSLLRRETDLSMACGVNLLIHPFTGRTMNTVLAPDGHCKTFDANADGFGRAEGCGVLVLKRYADAVKDGDRVWALIRGSAVVQEGASRSLGTPTKYCEALAMKLALEEAGVEPKDVSYVETHGTGTPVGDPLEVAAVAEVYAEGREEPLTIGSVKTNIGHTESCSGIAGIIKVVLALQNEVIPQHRNFETINPLINLESIPARIPLQPMEWKKYPNGKPRIAGVSSFGITGTDAHAILQETPILKHPKLEINDHKSRPSHILTISAKTDEALADSLRQFRNYLQNTNEDLLDIAYTANIGRGHFQSRTAIVGSDKADLLEKMKNCTKKVAPDETPKICFLFTGQGSQYTGMAKSLYDHHPTFKINFDFCDHHLSQYYGISIREALWGQNTKNLNRTIYSQTSIFCIEYCLLKLWESWGIKPDYVLGHSLGEFAAAVGAGILRFEDALKLVAERSRLIDALPGGKMLVLKQSLENVEILMKQAFGNSDRWLDYAAINSPDQTVLAGSEENVLAFVEFCKNNQVKTHILEATHAFHSRHMDPILEEYRGVASEVEYTKPTCVYVSGMEGRVVEDEFYVNAEYWVNHTRDKVSFASASKAVMELGCTLFLEVGPQPVLCALTMINSDGVEGIEPVTCLPSIRKQEQDWTTILNTLGALYVNGINVDWKNFDQFSNAKKVMVPFYPFQNKPHWFEIPDRGPGQIHPLVGAPISNATPVKLYQNQLDLEDAKFLRDHAIGNKIVFPGAGFMEMCLVSAHAATQCTESGYFHPTAPVTLENFTIESPLGLNEHEQTQMQAIVFSEDSGETKVTIYSKLVLDKDTQKWIRHASGVFSPYAVQTKEDEKNMSDTLQRVKERCIQQVVMNETYVKLSEFGLKFGPTFQTLKAMWKGENEVYFEVAVTDNPEKYICHPVVSDAMFQAVMISANPDACKLHVPVSVNKFVWFAKIETEVCYIHCRTVGKEVVAILYDSNGQVLAQMVGASLMETTVGAIMSALEAQKMSLPSTFEDVWRTQLGPMERRANINEAFNLEIFGESFQEEMTNRYNTISAEDEKFVENSNKLYAFYMIKGLYELGWSPEVGKTYAVNELVSDYKVLKTLKGFIRFMLVELTAEGYFEIASPDRENSVFRLIKITPPMDVLLTEIEKLYPEAHAYSPQEVEYVSLAGKKLAVLLTGKESALPILFPEDPNATASAESYYSKSRLTICGRAFSVEYFTEFFKHCSQVLEESKKVIRILEVGAGTGSFTKPMLPFLTRYPAGYEFTYTDISPVFFEMGQKLFENSKVKVLYRLLNIEEDPVSQGFIPNHYDLVIAHNVIHATQNASQSVSNLRNLLREDGFILISESIKPYRGTNLTFGLLDAYWKFTDFDLRPYNCEISIDKWNQVLKNNRFGKTANFRIFSDNFGIFTGQATSASYVPCTSIMAIKSSSTWVLFSDEGVTASFFHKQLLQLGNQVVLVTRSNTDCKKLDEFCYTIRPEEDFDMEFLFNSITNDSGLTIKAVLFLWGMNYFSSNYSAICKPYLSICKALIPNERPKLYVVTNGIISLGDQEVSPPAASPIWAMTKCFQNEQPNAVCRCIDLDDSIEPDADQMTEAFAELCNDDHEIYVAYRGNQRHVCRFLPWKIPNSILSFPKSERYHLLLPSSNAINDLRYGAMDKLTIKEGEVEIQVKAFALNFRDVFAVLKPSEEFETMNTIGIDYAGTVTAVGPNVTKLAVGDGVFATNLKGDALPSHLTTPADGTFKIPDMMTFCEAATIPAVAATAYKCLIEVAKLKATDTILIHTASGGVGLCAIQIAKYIGATIVATAGSKRKRAYLRNLGIKHIFHSRNTNYEKEIPQALNGVGVDVVLNSLTSAGFKEASLAVCNKGARFIEMSKLNTWTPDEVKAIRPDIKYDIVDLSACSPTEIIDLMKEIEQFIKTDCIRPIPYVRFDASEIRDALTYLQKAKHVGKIVVAMPEPDSKGGSASSFIPMFNDRSTYLITGGLGGIGFEVAKWMAQSGAKNIVLVGRNPPNEKAVDEIARINSTGKNLIAFQCDIGDYDQCKKLLETIGSNLPPLRGVMHAAGVLSDAIFSNQSWEKYQNTYHPKVNGGWNLHELTLRYPLEHFVMFSSAVATMGALGQSNHGSANFFLDSLAHYRHSIGLPATTINWGQWGQVGVAANLEVIGLRPFSVLQGISALERVMKTQKLQACVCEADFGIFKQLFTSCKKHLEELKLNQVDSSRELSINNEQFWDDYDAATDDKGRLEVIKKFVRWMIRRILKLGTDEPLNDDENFQDLGMDSLMMIEMKNVVQATLGKRATITVNSVKDCHTVNELASKLNQLLSGESDVAPPTREELIKLIHDDATLPDTIQLASESHCQPSDIRSILITGATGNMGPYLLRDISQRSQISKIYCLMRENKSLEPMKRLEKTLIAKDLLSQTQMDKIECIGGSLNLPRFGLSEDQYVQLSKNVDAVVHLAVKSNFTDIYKKIEKEDSDIRTINVKGTLNVLKFVCSVRTKHLFHASTIVANAKLDKDLSLAETWPAPDEFDEMPNSAYPISKFVCDRLMSQAAERGIPVKVFRFPAVGGDSKTGANVSYENNQLMLRMMSYLHLGCMPALPIPFFLLPVDTCSEFSLRIFFDNQTPYELYNVYNPVPHNETELVMIGDEMGYTVELVEPEQFRDKISSKEDSNLIHFLKEAAENKDAQNRFLKDNPAIMEAWGRNPHGAFVSKKLSKLIPGYPQHVESTFAVIRRDLKYAKESGVFSKFEI